ncbi:hypothetical protein QOT17_021105 [Balamuthia mandrillaris]
MSPKMARKGCVLPVTVDTPIPESFYTSIWGYEPCHEYTSDVQFERSPFSSMPHLQLGKEGRYGHAQIAPPIRFFNLPVVLTGLRFPG